MNNKQLNIRLNIRLTQCISMCNCIIDHPKPTEGDITSLAEEVKFLAEVILQKSHAKVSPDT